MSRRDHLEKLKQAAPAILPSLLLCDFGNLEREIRRLEEAGVAALHLDVMDGAFVPNLTYGMPIVAAVRRLTKLPIDVHLMIQEPGRFIQDFREAGADILTIHVESTAQPESVIQAIKDSGVGAGIALNPLTPMASLDRCLDICDLVLVMSVQAGFGGQAFQPVALERLQQLCTRTAGRVLLEVDGGINATTAGLCVQAGAECLVVGSAIFRSPDYGQAVRQLSSLAAQV